MHRFGASRSEGLGGRLPNSDRKELEMRRYGSRTGLRGCLGGGTAAGPVTWELVDPARSKREWRGRERTTRMVFSR